jgi:hypothetical protein
LQELQQENKDADGARYSKKGKMPALQLAHLPPDKKEVNI